MSEKVKSNFNDVTGETIASVKGNQKAYESGWERIFGKKDSTPKAEQALSRLVDEGVLTDNVVRRHEEQNIGKGVAVFEEEHIAVPFVEELLPSGIIGDEA